MRNALATALVGIVVTLVWALLHTSVDKIFGLQYNLRQMIPIFLLTGAALPFVMEMEMMRNW